MGRNNIALNTTRTEFASESEQEENQRNSGCFVSTKKAIIFAIFAILSLLAVGATIYFYGTNLNKRQDETNSNDLEALLNDSVNNVNFKNFRLPLHLQPLHYRLRIHPYLNEQNSNNFSFNGEVTILVRCKNTTNTIILHSDELQISGDEVKVATRKDVLLKALYELSPDSFPEIVKMDKNASSDSQKTDVNNSHARRPTSTVTDESVSVNDSMNNFPVINDTNLIYLYQAPQIIHIPIKRLEEIKKMSRYVIHLVTDLQVGINYTIHFKFFGKISSNLLGLYKTSYLNNEGDRRWILNTHFQPIFARRVFPCFDEPSFKASFEISIARRTNMSSIANMPLKESEKMSNTSGWVWDHFDPSPPMSPHLIGFTIFDYGYLKPNSTELGPLLKVWAPKHLLANAEYAISICPKILMYLQNYFGVKFPLSKIDLVAMPELYQTAMENWGLITFRKNALLIDSSSDSWHTRNHIFKTLIGKMTKQWFGNLVTMDWWSELWLAEGFSTYMEDVVENAIDPALEDLDTFSLRVTQTSLDSDKLKSVQSLRVNIKQPTQIEQLFDDVAYSKGSCLMRMLNCTLTQTVFRKGIHNFLKTWMYKSATIENFWDSFINLDKNASDLPTEVSIKEFMNSWITQDGYPVLSVVRDYKNGTAVITQKGFVYSHTVNDYLWYVPITYLKENENVAIKTLWMKKDRFLSIANFTYPGSKQWTIFNVEGNALYRVNYDSTNWKLLQTQLMNDSSKISATDRGQLLNDAFELANFGLLNYTFAFELTRYVKHKERSYIPWISLFNSLKQLNYIIRTTEYHGIFEQFILNLVKPTYARLGISENSQESQNDKLLRKFIMNTACTYNYDPCLEWSKMKYQEWMSTSNPDIHNPIQFDFRETVLCTAIKMGGEVEWNFLWRRTLNPSISTANLRIFYISLGCTREPWLITNYLQNAINGSIALQNAVYVWKSLAHPVGLNFGFAFLRANWNRIHKEYQHIYINLNTIFEEFLSKLSTKVDLEDLTVFYKNNKKTLDPVSSLMLSIVDRIKWRVSWSELKMKIVINWLLENSDI